ncbi:MAG: DEAD/DEAH box helicase [Nitrospiraceae bacterium]|nr:DEAD/DEAH box helicase [Nitrospiraceae bacterium]
MKPESKSRRLFGITRSKGKMYEFGLPIESHIAVPEGSIPDELFLLAVGTLGDAAAEVCNSQDRGHRFEDQAAEELRFSASFFDAFLASKFSPDLDGEVALLASATYYLASRPGSSQVLSHRIIEDDNYTPFETVARWLLQANWEERPDNLGSPFGELLHELVTRITEHFLDGSGFPEILAACNNLRTYAYHNATPQDLLLTDIICAVAMKRLFSSSWVNLPVLTDIPLTDWGPVILRDRFPKELWPSQTLLGEAGIFSGASGLIQMPTSSGKTRSIEIIIRSSFMSGRGKLTIIIVPFRALCHEISNSLRDAFRLDDVKVNELTDTLQIDYLEQLAELFDATGSTSKYVLALTPEKFLYLLRQTPSLVNSVGLVIYDEGHQFDTGSRGIVYELLLTEIKKLLPPGAQTILISAVIENAQAIAKWLIGENAQVVTGNDLTPTARSAAFATWAEKLGQMMFYESMPLQRPDYFVPRVIEQQKLEKSGREVKARAFPEKGIATDVSLYIGLRLVENGGTAIFCGRKDTASNLISRAVEIYERGFNLPSPSTYSDHDELDRMSKLYSLHFGELARSTKAAKLGIFCHHGNTPHGLRLSIEHGMQQGSIRFVVCTSTLAQGVNLPIRYLIVSGVYQGSQKIKVGDFQNLMGRAGRAGMHTEGLVIFADPQIYDTRLREPWRFNIAKKLLSPDRTDPTSTSLLSILEPLVSPAGAPLELEPDQLCTLLLQDEPAWEAWAQTTVDTNPHSGFTVPHLIGELRTRRRLITAIESYLMANRGTETFDEFLQKVTQLTVETLAYNLANDPQKSSLVRLFTAIGEYIESRDASPAKQAEYGKTLLGIEVASRIEAWTNQNRNTLLSLHSNEGFLNAVWVVFSEHSDDKFFTGVLPESLPIQLATMWITGTSYQALFDFARASGGTKPWGSKRRTLQDEDILQFCENTLGFECPLIVAAITQFLFGTVAPNEASAAPLMHFHKSLKYGIPDSLAVSCYELGFADRMLAQALRTRVLNDGYTGLSFALAINPHRDSLATMLSSFPRYFELVLNTLV